MATAADEIGHVNTMPPLAKLFMAGVALIMLGSVFAMMPFLTDRPHGFSQVLILPFVLLFSFCAVILYWGVKASSKFLAGANVLLVLNIVGLSAFSDIIGSPHSPAMAGVVVSALYFAYFLRSERLRRYCRKP